MTVGVADRDGQTLPQVPSAADPTGQAGRAIAEEGLWATHLAMRAEGAPRSVSRRALSRALHISPCSVRSWARLGMVAVDSAVRPVVAGTETAGNSLAEECK